MIRTCALYETDACFQGHYSRGVESSAFEAVRKQIGLYQTFGIAACSSLNYGMYRIAAVRNEESRSCKTVKALVSRGAEDIDSVTETYWDNTADLCAVRNEAYPPFSAKLRNASVRQKLTCYVACKGTDDGFCVIRHETAEGFNCPVIIGKYLCN